MKAFVSDLDNTLIYSYKKEIGKDKVSVELYKGREISYMTKESYYLLNELHNKILFVPVSTRSIEQYRRIQFSNHWTPKIALVSNGGTLLENGQINVQWRKESFELIEECIEEQEKAIDILEKDSYRILDTRKVDDLFVFTKSSNVEFTLKRLEEKLNRNLVDIFHNGCKIYVLPKKLDKGTAVERLKKRYGIYQVMAAGDSIFDVPMLNIADTIYFPEELKDYIENDSSEKIMSYNNELLSDKILNGLMQPYSHKY